MSKSLLSILFLVLMLFNARGQSSAVSTSVVRSLELTMAALDREAIDSVTVYLGQARDACLASGNLEDYVNGFTDVAKIMFRKGYVDQGIQMLKRVRADVQAQLGMDTPFEIEICYQLARGFYFQQAYDSCTAYASRNLLQLESMSPEETVLDRANHYNLLGAAYNSVGQASKALEEYQKVLAIRIAILGNEDNQVASIYFNLGNAYSNLKLYNKALDAYKQGIKIREKVLGSKHPSLASIYFNVGAMYDDKGEYDNAIIYFDQALAIYKENPKEFEDQIADIFNNMAISYKNKGAYQESSSFHQQSIQTYEQLTGDNSEKIADVYTNLAILAGLKGDYTQAVALHEKSLHLYQQKLDSMDSRVVAAQNNLGIAYADSGDFEGALAQLKGLVPLIENSEAHREQFANLNNDIADVYFKLGNLEEAKAYTLKALTIQQKLFKDKSYKLASTYNNLAKIAEAEQDQELALECLQHALETNHTSFDAASRSTLPPANGYLRHEFFVESLMLKASLMSSGFESDQSSLLQTMALYQIVGTVLTEVQNELISSEDKLRLSEKMYELSQHAIENCLQLADATGNRQYLEDAFRYVEKSKNTVLTQSITANHAKQFANIPDSLVLLEDQLQSNIRYYKLQLTERPDSASTILYQNELFAAEQAYRALIRQLEENYPLYYQLKYDRNVPGVRAIQFTMPEKTAIVSYFIGDSVLYSFVITKDNFSVYRSPIGKDFYEQQVGLRKSIFWQLNEDYLALGHTLYQELFPFDLGKNIESLIIIPDGTLSKLPFETLLTRKVSTKDDIEFSKLPYLLNEYQISYALSGTLFYQQQIASTGANEKSDGLLAYAPVFSEPQAVGLFSTGTRNPLSAISGGGMGRTITMDGKYVSALPATADEVQSIAAVFQQKKQKVTTYLFQNANEVQLKYGDLKHSKYIHIATHGFINEAQPDLSGLLLFPDSTEQEDHILYSGEVYGLNLQAKLVVLSACETGLGKVASGEGILGLSRAFFYAGAENLVVSLWKVQDQATADLMVRFYQRHLNNNQQYFAAPLRQAKLDMIRSETFSHPYFWSSFVLIGR